MKICILSLMIGSAIAFGPGTLSADEPPSKPQASEEDGVDGAFPFVPIVMGSYGLVTVALGAGFALQAYQENDSYNKKVNGEYPHATHALADDIKLHSIVANVLMFSGAAVALGGILWWILDDDYRVRRAKRARATALMWRPMIGPVHASVVFEF
jgi:hypothetical protein